MQTGEADASWQLAHGALVSFAQERAELDFEEGQLLLAAKRAHVHRHQGYGSFGEYVERLFGYARRVTYDKLRVAEALESLPELARGLREGSFTFSHVRELTRVVTPETEAAWLERARGRTSRQVEQLVSGRRRGALPDSRAEPELQRHVLRFEVSGETLASFREAVAKLRREAGQHLDDDATLLLLARQVLGGPTDDGRASYQVALDVCEDCQRARQLGDGKDVDVSLAAAEMARCDGQQLPSAHVGELFKERAAQDIAPAVRRAVLRRDHRRCQVPGCAHATFLDLHHVDAQAQGGGHDASNLVTLCGDHHRALHEGALIITGSADSKLEFWHADGTSYGSLPVAPRVPVVQRVPRGDRALQALRGLDFGEKEARRALEQTLDELPPGADTEALIRRCLELLSERALSRSA